MKITNWGAIREREVRPGIFRQEFSSGKLQVIKYRYRSGSVFENHSHPEEQLTILLEGELIFNISDARFVSGPGDITYIPGGTEHSAENRGITEAITLNFFTPPKKV